MPRRGLHIKAIKDEIVREATGKSWKEWFTVLDEWGAQGKRHFESSKYLREEYGLNAWWSHAISFRYEWERGLRE